MHQLLLLVLCIDRILLILNNVTRLLFFALCNFGLFVHFGLHLRIVKFLVIGSFLAIFAAAFLLLLLVHEFLKNVEKNVSISFKRERGYLNSLCEKRKMQIKKLHCEIIILGVRC